MPNPLLTLAQEISTLEEQLAAKRQELIAQLSEQPMLDRRKPVASAPQRHGPTSTLSDRARKVLARHPEGLAFGELFSKLKAGDPDAKKLALRSFIGKARDRGEMKFEPSKDGRGGKYLLVDLKSRPAGQPPQPAPQPQPAAPRKAKKKSPTGNASGATNGKPVATSSPQQLELS